MKKERRPAALSMRGMKSRNRRVKVTYYPREQLFRSSFSAQPAEGSGLRILTLKVHIYLEVIILRQKVTIYGFADVGCPVGFENALVWSELNPLGRYSHLVK